MKTAIAILLALALSGCAGFKTTFHGTPPQMKQATKPLCDYNRKRDWVCAPQ